MDAAARRAGAPAGSIGWMTTVTLEGTQELMKQRDVAVILATGGMGLVRAAYSAGKPAYGVGPGNAPAFIERTANVKKAVHDVITGKTFDNGVLCSSENSVVVDEPIAAETKREFQAQGGYFMNTAEMDALARVLITPQRLPNPALVGRTAVYIAEKCGIPAPADTRVLLAPLEGVGRDYPLSIEKLCPVLSYYVVKDWREGCERCKQILRYGGMGHTMSIHSQNEQVILEFGLHKPAFRIVVNSPTTHGSVGLSTGLDPAMTLGCGGYGGNITSDNISPRHLLNIKRLAYELSPVVSRWDRSGTGTGTDKGVGSLRLPSAPPRPPAPTGISADALSRRIDEFLGSRGFRPDGHPMTIRPTSDVHPTSTRSTSDGHPTTTRSTSDGHPMSTGLPSMADQAPLDFVCEDDVRRAIQAGRQLVVAERAIVTPAARDLGEQHRIFSIAPWRG
jgi:acetaldehyde dehydrogenase (acetylating)